MRVFQSIVIAAFAAMAAVGCTSTLKGRQLAEYCSDADNAGKDLCAVNTEIQATRAALAQTDQKATEALGLAQQAKATADMANGKGVVCTTKTIRKASTGSCDAGYTLMGCTQTRYTYSAGGPSIMRAISDQSCRFNSRVLEMQVRCCMVGQPMQSAEAEQPAPEAPKPTQPQPTS